MPSQRLRFAPLVLTLLVGACAQQPVDSGADSTDSATPVRQDSTPAPRNYSPESLADLLIAEVAAQRELYGVTMGYYGEQARAHRDPLVASQAAKLAAYLNDPVAASELGEIWLEGEPESRDARQLLALSYIEQGERDKAAAQIDELMKGDPQRALVELVSQAHNLDEAGNVQLLAALGSLTDRYPDQAPLWYARALNLEMEKQPQLALNACEQAIRLDSTHEDSVLLKARLLHELERDQDAEDFLRKTLRKYPDAKRVRVLYARLLIQTNQLNKADEQLAWINDNYQDDPEIRLSLALLAMEQGDSKQGPVMLDELLEQNFRSDEIHFYLGHAAETAGELQTAMDHYMTVQGPNQLRARVQAARLMNDRGLDAEAAALMTRLRDQHPEQLPTLYAAEADMLSRAGNPERAMALLSDALAQLPDNTELLYTRAMTAERLDNIDQLEADLRRMLELQPEDATALNALGYTLADRTERFDEAEQYITAAYDLRPNDPAVIDSMGWLRYRQGRPDEALPYLQQAYELFPDQEVAAHLGEVLWALGQKKQARQIWREALAAQPDSRKIPETVLRLTGSSQP